MERAEVFNSPTPSFLWEMCIKREKICQNLEKSPK